MRSLIAGIIAAVLLACTPAVAQAAFRGTATGTLTAATYVIPAPATIGGTYSCDTTRPFGSTINVTSYGKVPRATAYRLTLTAPDGTTMSQTFTTSSVSLTKPSAVRNGTYTYELIALVGTWTGTPYTGTYTC